MSELINNSLDSAIQLIRQRVVYSHLIEVCPLRLEGCSKLNFRFPCGEVNMKMQRSITRVFPGAKIFTLLEYR